MNGRHIERRKAALEKARHNDVEFQEWMGLMDEAEELDLSLRSQGVAIPKELAKGCLTWDTCAALRNGLKELRKLGK